MRADTEPMREHPALFPADEAEAYLIGGPHRASAYGPQQLTLDGTPADAQQGALFTP